MTSNAFIWIDLSTTDPAQARADYARIVGWSFSGVDGYALASRGGAPVAAVYPTPDRFRGGDLPSFWMSYVRVDDLDAAVAKARAHDGVRIEVAPEESGWGGRIALVRDPSGAGFTLYEGPDVGAAAVAGPGSVVGWRHHGPDIALVASFYADLFGWRFERIAERPWPIDAILGRDGAPVARAEAIPDALRGPMRYWIPRVAVRSAAAAIDALIETGGRRVADSPDGDVLIADARGAHLLLAPESR